MFVVPVTVDVNCCFAPAASEALVGLIATATGAAAAVPVPLKLTVIVLPVELLLVILNLPDAEPATVGMNFTGTVSELPELKVAGKVTVPSLNPVPDTLAALTVTDCPPVEVKVTVSVVVVPTWSLPKAMLEALELSVAALPFNCR